jgi:SpoVK/Ycf46/Vps4 family AAA+-type ATPase
MMKPNLFIIGAPKCGTTALARYLADHERVFFSSPKEPDYFARHMWIRDSIRNIPSFRTSLDHYLALFEDADPARHVAIGEGSVMYLCSRRSLEEIFEFNPEARVIVMMRNPVELVHSLHSELCLHLAEDQEDFETAWRLQDARAAGRCIPRGAERVEPLLYGQVGRLGAQLQTVLEIFPRSQVLWLFFDDFKRDTPGAYRSVLEFLDVPGDGRADFPVVNPNQKIRPTRLMRLMKENQGLRSLSQRLKSLTGVRSWGLYAALQRRSQKRVERKALPEAFLKELAEYFSEDIALLESITGRDLAEWKSM